MAAILTPSEAHRARLFRSIVSDYAIFFAFLALVIVLAVLEPKFLRFSNVINILKQSAVIGIISVGATLVILIGGIDLSPGSIVAMSGVLGALFAAPNGLGSQSLGFLQGVRGTSDLLASSSHALPVLVPILVAVLAGSLVGLFNGLLVARGGVPAFIVTLGTMTIARGIALLCADGGTVPYVTDRFKSIGGSLILGIPILIYVFVAVVLVFWFVLNRTKFGRHIYAVGGNEQAALVSGVNVAWTKIVVFLIAGTLSGLSGLLLASRIAVGSPVSGAGYELDAIASVVIGGTSLSGGVGRLSGTIVGVFFIGVMSNGLDMLNVSSYFQSIIKGLIIVFAVLYDMKSKRRT